MIEVVSALFEEACLWEIGTGSGYGGANVT